MSIQTVVSGCLKSAIYNCNIRGLLASATWASEQLNGLNEDPEEEGSILTESDLTCNEVNLFDFEINVHSNELGAIFLGSNLLSAGEYQRCTHTLQIIIKKFKAMERSPSKVSLFLYFYSKYLAGEKIRNQLQEKKKSTKEEGNTHTKQRKVDNHLDKDTVPLNPSLKELYRELSALYDAQYMDGFLLFLFAVVTRDFYEQYGIPQDRVLDPQTFTLEATGTNNLIALQPYRLFLQSLAHCPWNW